MTHFVCPDAKSLREFDKRHFKQVKKRMKKLLNRLLNDGERNEGKVYLEKCKSKKGTEKFIEKLRKKRKYLEKQKIKLIELSRENRKVVFKSGKTEISSLDINLRYFRIVVIRGNTREYYVYFEQLLEKKIFCFLMNENDYERDNKKEEFGSNVEIWKEMKLQMKMWNQIFNLEAVIKSVSPLIEAELIRDLRSYKKVKGHEEREKASALEELFSSGSEWILFSYLTMAQLNQLFPSKYQLPFMLNLYADRNIQQEFLLYMKRFISKIALKDGLEEEGIIVTPILKKENNYYTPARCLIVAPQNDKSVGFAVQQLNSFNTMEKLKSGSYPLEQIPLIISGKSFVDSPILNIDISKDELFDNQYQTEKLENLRIMFCSGLEKLFSKDLKEKKSKLLESCQNTIKGKMEKIEKDYAYLKGKVGPEYLRLAVWLKLLLGEEASDFISYKLEEVQNGDESSEEEKFRVFLKQLLADYETYNFERPDHDKKDIEVVTPFIADLEGGTEEGYVIAYPLKELRGKISSEFSEKRGKRFLLWLYKMKLICPNDKEFETRSIRGSNSSIPKRYFAFDLEKVKRDIFFDVTE